MKAAVVDSQKTVTVQDISPPRLVEGGALICVTGCGLCGSDLDKLLHRPILPGTVLGHEVVGEIEILSDLARVAHPHLQPGQRVAVAHHVPCQTCYFCRHASPSMCQTFKSTNISPGGFAETIAVSDAHLAHTVFALPDTMSDTMGACIEPLACCLRAIDRIPSGTGHNMAMIGLGFIGLLSTQYAQLQGYTVCGLDIRAERAALAADFIVDLQTATVQDALKQTITAQTEGRGVDVVFLTVVNPQSIQLAMQIVRDGGILVLFASFGGQQALINQNELFFREITVITSYSPSLEHLRQAYDLLKGGKIRLDKRLTQSYPLAALPTAIAAYQQGDILKALITV